MTTRLPLLVGGIAAAIMIINDPVDAFVRIQQAVNSGYLVRTRADADTLEARSNETRRREAAFASGAHAISTDYYQPATHFQSSNDAPAYHVPPIIRCNPLTAPPDCQFHE